MGSLGIYVHVPFCVKKCNYCDFLSFPLKRETDCSEVENYVNALQKEICNPFKMPESPAEVDTIYLGGGTPRLLSAAERRPCFHHRRLSGFWQPSGRSFG